ncbi:NAD(P)-dependent dehydrogenase, short-chain alcohol dehydrogenase family [Aquiflexum balticum DSM 16537]|uniref:NAD(P)-dependent dehydrogenase, short-chain alcohol dehydrogenase family n=1 Tax=Aquiflexum balticum DSM 16537 TaxID=758820 RepID=A0A1W2H0D8_9BACT|nr:SDR family oxidoreductase [Aquiflexum balticum]SMD42244.1 NAD(P)-dependent dehydrogenase, short-chain alcohol dehydrogenase family [Aquiflexum balticum DSM 16537]
MKLQNQTLIITGATSGMGKAIAIELANEGANLILSGRDQKRGNALMAELLDKGQVSKFLPGDVGDIEYNKQLVDLALATFGGLDGVVTNAGMLGLAPVTSLDPYIWDRTFRTNVDAVFFLLKYALPEMLKRPSASVVGNASIAAFKSFPNHPAYCASKAALVALAKQVAVDYGPKVRINAICPGPVDTPFIHDSAIAFPDPVKAVENAGKATLLKRLGEPEDIAKLVLFLVSDDASWITGSAFTIDGGILAGG